MTKEEWYKQLFKRLGNSKFCSSFHLKQKDIDYINEEGFLYAPDNSYTTYPRQAQNPA